MAKNLIHQSDWMTINEVTKLGVLNKASKVVEIDIEGVIGGSFFWDEDNKESLNTKEKMRKELKALSELKADTIIVNINSPGGSVSHGLSIHDMLAQHKAEIITRITGMTASIATVIAQAGNKREMSDNALALIHRASYTVIASLNQNDLDNLKDDLQVIDNKILNIYEKRSGVNRDKLTELIDAQNGQGRWLDSNEAKEFGLIDEVFEPMQAVAMLTSEMLNKYKLPNIMAETKEKELDKGLLDKIADLIKGKKTPETPETQDKQENEVENKSDISGLQNEIKELKASNVDLSAKLDELRTKYNDSIVKLNDLLSEVVKSNSKSTNIGGAAGVEDNDTAIVDPLKDSLNQDLKKLRNEFEVTHD
jgi:ATP-dependent Clp protease protease subunit